MTYEHQSICHCQHVFSSEFNQNTIPTFIFQCMDLFLQTVVVKETSIHFIQCMWNEKFEVTVLIDCSNKSISLRQINKLEPLKRMETNLSCPKVFFSADVALVGCRWFSLSVNLWSVVMKFNIYSSESRFIYFCALNWWCERSPDIRWKQEIVLVLVILCV